MEETTLPQDPEADPKARRAELEEQRNLYQWRLEVGAGLTLNGVSYAAGLTLNGLSHSTAPPNPFVLALPRRHSSTGHPDRHAVPGGLPPQG